MKKIFKDENEKRAAILTALTMFILFLWMFFHTAFTYQDPPEEYGMEVNFGTTDMGQGDNQTTEPIKMQPTAVETPQPEEVVEETPVEETTPVEEVVETPVEDTPEEVMTEDTTEEVPVVEPVIETPKEDPKEEVKPVDTPKPVTETPKPTPVKTPTQTAPAPPKPDAATENAFLNVLNGPATTGTSNGSEGDDNVNGDKGNENGDPHAPDYYTNPGNGSGGNYNLIGRLPLRRPIPDYLCQKEGRVVVSIKVNRLGKVISAVPGAKGSTTTEKCLLDQAKKAALNTKWQPAANAPEKQIGKIIYNFSLH